MEYKNVIHPSSRLEFREWLEFNHKKESECYIPLIKKEPKDDGHLYYIDAVYEALCFGWIDNRQAIIDGIRYVRVSKRIKNSSFNELNKERARLLIKQGLMQEEGYKVLPDLNEEFIIPNDIKQRLINENIYDRFISYSALYQRIRISYIMGFKIKEEYDKALNRLVEMTKQNKLYGQWNDYNRLK